MSINNVSSVRPEINEIMSKIRELSNKSNVFPTKEVSPTSSAGGGFESVLSVAKQAVSQVNDLQTASEAVKTAYITGDGDVSMSQVIAASQKSKLAFEGLLVVRNKILEAYKEVMNMQV